MTEASVTHTPAPETLARGTESPMAKTRRRTTSWTAFVGASRMWALAAICLIVAATLVITSLKKTGTEITISFPEGHGLKHGDRVRYRGIEVGEVEKVALAANMRGIDVTVLLAPEAENLAREGTRFWIVRPEISLTSVKGLDTAVSGKFIAVSPGDPNASFQTGFAGLSQAPADEWAERGLSIVLRSEESHGLAPGAPVLWRGLKVGQVLSVDLAFDTRFVDIHAKIDQKYVPLVRENSKFWVNKGLGIDAGLTGFKFEAESLETIARGGISFTTPRTEREFNAPSSGQVFTLYAEAQKKWLELKETASLVNVQVPPMTVLRFVWKEKSLGFARTKERRVCGAVHSVARHRIEVICPADLLDSQDRALPDTWSVTIVDPSQNGRI
ncbi:MAG: MCE family protein, partial [Planctomycetaceae bacterium]|nr:MCE family protein [Planctomycetaceae bacterium]